jgi:NADH-quinone oxidoreductase subunit N
MNSFLALAPHIAIVIAALLVLLLEVFFKREDKSYLGYISLAFLIAAGIMCILLWNKAYSYFEGALFLDNLALFFAVIFVIALCFVVLISMKYLLLQDVNYGEYYSLMLLALAGMLIMVTSFNFLVIFLGLEVLSVSSYALAGLRRKDEKSSEAAVKYFLLGSFASAFLLFGLALLYGASRSIDIPEIMSFFRQSQNGPPLMALVGMALVIIGFGFKIALVPFHMWTPDVYQGAPTPVTAFFSIGPKAVGFAVLLRMFYAYWDSSATSQLIFWVLYVLSALTMVVGNLIALRQTNLKRLLAYSSIAHAGYILIALLAKDYTSLVFYLTVYFFMNIGAFSAVIALSKEDQEYLELDDYAGVGFKYPWIGAALAIFLFSLAGFPPTGGFLAKFYVFSSAVRQGLVPLVIIGVLASLVSVFYYLRVIVFMYMREPSREVEISTDNPGLFLVLFLCLYGVLQLGLYPGNILVVIRLAVSSLF